MTLTSLNPLLNQLRRHHAQIILYQLDRHQNLKSSHYFYARFTMNNYEVKFYDSELKVIRLRDITYLRNQFFCLFLYGLVENLIS